MPGPDKSTIASGAVAKLLSMLPSLGLEPGAVCEAAGVDAAVSAQVDARVPLPSLHALWEAVTERVPRADLALALAESYNPGDYGLVGFVALSCASLGEALAQVERYLCLWADEPRMHLRPDGTMEVRFRAALPDRPGLHRTVEAALAELLHGARRATQRRLVAREVRFRHPPPPHAEGREAFEAFFGGPVRFGQAATEMALSPADLALPMPQLDAQLGAFLRGLANDALARRGEVDTLLDQVRRILAEELQRGLPGVETVARRIGTSGRTLRRRLEDEGTTFREVLDRTRGELAENYVRDARLPLSEVAFLLGFSEPSAFTRAFKRWTGATPGAWRQRVIAGRGQRR